MVRAKKYESMLTWRWITLGGKNVIMIVLRPDGENCDVLEPAGNVHLSSTVFSSYPAWIYPVRSSCSKINANEKIRKWLDKWEEGSVQNLIFADHSLYWIVPPLLVQSIEVVCYIPQPEKIHGTRLTYNCAHLRLTKESLTIFFVKIIWVKIFLSENFFWVIICLSDFLFSDFF